MLDDDEPDEPGLTLEEAFEAERQWQASRPLPPGAAAPAAVDNSFVAYVSAGRCWAAGQGGVGCRGSGSVLMLLGGCQLALQGPCGLRSSPRLRRHLACS